MLSVFAMGSASSISLLLLLLLLLLPLEARKDLLGKFHCSSGKKSQPKASMPRVATMSSGTQEQQQGLAGGSFFSCGSSIENSPPPGPMYLYLVSQTYSPVPRPTNDMVFALSLAPWELETPQKSDSYALPLYRWLSGTCSSGK